MDNWPYDIIFSIVFSNANKVKQRQWACIPSSQEGDNMMLFYLIILISRIRLRFEG